MRIIIKMNAMSEMLERASEQKRPEEQLLDTQYSCNLACSMNTYSVHAFDVRASYRIHKIRVERISSIIVYNNGSPIHMRKRRVFCYSLIPSLFSHVVNVFALSSNSLSIHLMFDDNLSEFKTVRNKKRKFRVISLSCRKISSCLIWNTWTRANPA